MELAHSLLLNEEALSRIAESKRPVFIFEWLRFLDKVLVAAQKSDIKESQQKLINQLTNEITESRGPPIRKLLARCLATIFSVGDTSALFEMINKCNDIVRNKDDSPSYLPTKLAAVSCIGGMYEKLGRMVGRSYEETINLLIKSLKNAESQGRCEIMLTLQKVIIGLGSAGSNCYKDVFKAARNCLTDRSMTVRCAAAACLRELVNEAPFMYTTELDNLTSLCFRAMDGSNYDVRCDVAMLLGHLLAAVLQQSTKTQPGTQKTKQLKLEDVLNLLGAGFLLGGTGFLKSSSAGEMIKGGSNVNREIRVGVTHAYVEFGKCMGGVWLERNIAALLAHLFSLVSNPRTTQFHVDAVYARKCVNFILRSLFGSQLGERAQIAAAKELNLVIVRQMNALDATGEPEKSNQSAQPEAAPTHHVLVCALQELGCLVQTLGTSSAPLVSEPSTGIIEPVVSVLIHPAPAARLSAAWCLRSIAVALPSQMTILIDRCMNRMQHLKSSTEAISGYSFALAALLGGVRETALGIPHVKGKQIFSIGEELLRTATQNSRLSLQRTQSGWLLLGALMTLGPSVVKTHLPRMLLLWRNAFPRSTKELESEKARGDAFTWQVTLEGRAGALGAMHSFVLHCSELVTEDVTRRILPPLECALTMTVYIASIIKMYGTHLKASAATVRLRLYDVLSLLPPDAYECAFSALLRELVAEFTLTDNPANTTTSLLRSMCHADDSIILGSWLQETDHKAIEDQLQPNSASGSGALEHDPAFLYMHCPQGESVPGPLPLGVAVIDSSVRLFGLVFPRVAHKHRLQMLEHFAECIKQAKSSRQQAVQINIFTAVLSALKCLAETKTGFGNIEVRRAAVDLVLGALGSSNQILRCAAGEALGRMVQVVGENKFIAEMAQYSFDRLKSARDAVTRTGHSLALGCLHRYVGGMGSGQHLNTSVSILLALAQDSSSPLVQVWALHALALIADSGGPMFRTFVEPSLSLVLQLLLSVPPSNVDVHQCLGKCLAALITTIGPELHGNTSTAVATARLSCLVCCAVMQDHPDSVVQSEAISCLQQLHLFAPRHVNLTTLVPHLCETLSSEHLILRRAVVSCLRQLVQREAQEVSDHALSLAGDSKGEKASSSSLNLKSSSNLISETGLEGALFSLLDKDSDRKLCSDIQNSLISLLQALATDNLTRWLFLIKDVLQASSEASAVNTPVEEGEAGQKDEDDDEGINIKNLDTDANRPIVAPRWPTRVFAIECMLKIMGACEGNEAHFQLGTAKALKQKGQGDFLVLHLSELVRMAFIAATSDSDRLRLAGLAALQEIIGKFAKVPEPEFPGHVLLEQYQAQVGAALRPAFTPETAPDVTAAACEVCSCWIGSGVARDLNDLRRVHQLLVSSLTKLKDTKDSCLLYSESAQTMEKLSVLKSWAEVYMVTMEEEKQHEKQKLQNNGKSTEDGEDVDEFGELVTGNESLLSLVQPEVKMLSKHWLAVLKDYALLSLPPEYSSQLPSEGGAFYTFDTMESSRLHYKKAWPPILYAVSLWLKEMGFMSIDKDSSRPANMQADESDANRFHLLVGICIEALCNPTSVQTLETVNICLKAMHTLLDDPWTRLQLGNDQALAIELLNVLHRLLLTRDSPECFSLIIDVVKQIIKAARAHVENERALCKEEEDKKSAVEAESNGADGSKVIGDGGKSGDIIPGKSLVFATLEVCLCVLVRHMPALNPTIQSSSIQMSAFKQTSFPEATTQLLASTLQIMADLPSICSAAGSLSVLPTVLFLTTGVIKELAPKNAQKVSPLVTIALQCLKIFCVSPMTKDPTFSSGWNKLLQTTLATLLDYAVADTDKDKLGIEDTTLLLALAIFFVSSPVEVVSPPDIMDPCLDIFLQGWMSGAAEIQLKCIQSLISICQHANRLVSTPFIHTVAPPILEHLSTRPTNDLQLAIHVEAIRLAECLVNTVEEEFRSGLLAMIVPLLVSLLIDQDKLHESSALLRQLHEVALQKLIDIATQYRMQFNSSTHPDHLNRLRSAIQAQQQLTSKQNPADRPAARPSAASQQSAQPTIKLKMDFSNFAA